MLETFYEIERTGLAAGGQNIVYFDDPKRLKLRPQPSMPVIYEVEETQWHVDRDVTFPYSVQIFHEPLSRCELTNEDNFFYDSKIIPENAEPLEPYVVPRRFDTPVDDNNGLRGKRSSRLLKRLDFKSHATVVKRSSLNINLNAQLPKVTWNNHLPQREFHYHTSQRLTAETCQDCLYNDGIRRNGSRFSTGQIVFSINCCCNRTTPIEYHTEITYMTHSGFSPFTEAKPENCPGSYRHCGYLPKSIADKNMCIPAQEEMEEPRHASSAYTTVAFSTVPVPSNVSTGMKVRSNHGDNHRDCHVGHRRSAPTTSPVQCMFNNPIVNNLIAEGPETYEVARMVTNDAYFKGGGQKSWQSKVLCRQNQNLCRSSSLNQEHFNTNRNSNVSLESSNGADTHILSLNVNEISKPKNINRQQLEVSISYHYLISALCCFVLFCFVLYLVCAQSCMLVVRDREYGENT